MYYIKPTVEHLRPIPNNHFKYERFYVFLYEKFSVHDSSTFQDSFTQLIDSDKYCIDSSPFALIFGLTMRVKHYLANIQNVT